MVALLSCVVCQLIASLSLSCVECHLIAMPRADDAQPAVDLLDGSVRERSASVVAHSVKAVQTATSGARIEHAHVAALDVEMEAAAALGERCAARHAPRACDCLLYTSPSPRDLSTSRMPSSA